MPETKILKGEATGAIGDLAVGDTVRIRQRRNVDGSFTILAVRVVLPRVAGVVTAIGADSLTIRGRRGATRAIALTGTTTYRLGKQPGSKSDVKVGSRIAAQGSTGAGDTFTASAVIVQLVELGGEVTATGDASITIRRRNGSTATIHLGPGTVIRVRGRDAAGTLADVVVGGRVQAEGTIRADGSLDAVVVRVGKAKPRAEASPTG